MFAELFQFKSRKLWDTLHLCSILHCEHKKQLRLHVFKKLATSTVVLELSLLKCTENGKSGHGGGGGLEQN